MNAPSVHQKKSAPCRYFASKGTCFYGDNCQFSHIDPTGSVKAESAGDVQPHVLPTYQAGGFVNGQGQHAGNDASFVDQFASFGVGAAAFNRQQASLKGRNPGAVEFVPKASTPGFTPALQHSSSTPSFQNFSQMSSVGASDIGSPGLLAGSVLSSGASPRASPGMSPSGSPLIHRRPRGRSPALQTMAVAAAGLNDSGTHLENVGGTTYFYPQEDVNAKYHHDSTASDLSEYYYPGTLPHVQHLKQRHQAAAFFVGNELKSEILTKHAMTLAHIDPNQNPDMPAEVDTYHQLFPLEQRPSNPLHKSSLFDYRTSVYKAINAKDGLVYCLKRVHGYRLTNTKCMQFIEQWKRLQHANIVQLREVFTTKAFADHSMIFAYDFFPCCETLFHRHFSQRGTHHLNGYSNPYNLDGQARPYSAGKGVTRQQAGFLPESLIWAYIVQLTSALRVIHQQGLAARVIEPSKILLTDNRSRLRLNCVGIPDVLSCDSETLVRQHQQEDLMSLGQIVLALACNSLIGTQREHLQTSLELVARNYSPDLKNLIIYLLRNSGEQRTVNEIMPMIGARFYSQLDASLQCNDQLYDQLAKEVENGRLFRLMCKLGAINERPEFSMDANWAETGNRYMLKLFRDTLFHQVDENGAPWLDMAHVVQLLNKLDAGSSEKLTLMSRCEQNVLVVTYAELKRCLETSFSDLFPLPGPPLAGPHPAGPPLAGAPLAGPPLAGPPLPQQRLH